MPKISTSKFEKGIFIKYKNEPHEIIHFQFVNPGKGSAFVRTKLKNVNTGKVQEFTYKSGEQVEEIPISVQEMQYLYRQADELVFMNRFDYEQIQIPQNIIGDFIKYLKEGDIYQILVHNGKAVGMRPPQKIRLKVTEAEEGARGNTATGAKKTVTLETGIKVSVPLFIKKGDLITIDPETGNYLERERQKS